jgi:voltage-gated potassium channel
MTTLRKRVFDLLEPTLSGLRSAMIIEYVLIALITCNIAAILLETVPEISSSYSTFFEHFEVFSVIIFTIEYALRLWTCAEKAKYKRPVTGRLRYSLSRSALIDLFSILPFYLNFLPIDLRILRVIRLFRLLRMLKIARYLTALNLIFAVIRDRREQLLVVIMFIFFLLVIISTVMFYVEGPAQPDKFSSIPATMWWGIATLTTVGYGDMVPITMWGKLLAGIIAVIGVGMYALPAGILSAGISEHLHNHKNRKTKRCPHCGKEL